MSEPKKKRLTAGAWQEARELVWRYRHRLAVGLVMMLGQSPRGAGTARDDGLRHRRRDSQWTDRSAVTCSPASVSVPPLFRRRQRSGCRRCSGSPPSVPSPKWRKKVMAHVTRLPIRYFDSNPDRDPHFSDHDGRRGYPEPGGDRARSALRKHRDGDRGVGCALLSQLAADQPDARYSRCARRVDVVCLLTAAPDLSRTGQDQRQPYRSAGGNPGWDPYCEGLHGREARAAGICQRGAHAIPQRRQGGDGSVRPDLGRHARHGNHRCVDGHARGPGAHGRHMDDRGPRAIHPLYRFGDRPGGADIVDWYAESPKRSRAWTAFARSGRWLPKTKRTQRASL